MMIEEKKQVDVICKEVVAMIRGAGPVKHKRYLLLETKGRFFIGTRSSLRPGLARLARLSGREINEGLSRNKRYELLIQLIALQIRDGL